MANITYTRSVSFNDYVDGQTIVSAGGNDGFNVRFHALEKEFDTISSVVGQVNAAINALGVAPAPAPTKLVLTPTLVQTSASGWSHQLGNALKPAGQTSAQGMMSVSLPQGTTIQSLRVIGANSGTGSLRLILYRQALAAAAQTLDQIAIVSASTNPFDINSPAVPTFAVVDNGGFKYFVAAQLDNAAAADIVTVSAFQITYLPSS